MIAVRLELRRGGGRWLALPFIALGLYAAFQAIPRDGFSWPQAVYSLGQAGLVMGPVAAGFAAWSGSRARRRRMLSTESLAARSAVQPALTELAAFAVWTAAAYAVVVAVVFTATSLETHWSGPDLLRTFAGMVGILLQASLGYALGRLIPFRLTPLVVAFALYAWVGGFQSSQSFFQWNLFLPDNLQLYDVYVHLNQNVSAVQVFWYLSLAAFALSVWAVLRVRSRTAALALATAVAATAGSFALVNSFHGRENLPGAYVVQSCAGRDPVICLHPSLTRTRAAVRQAVTPIVTRLAGTPFAVSLLEQRPRGVGGEPSPGGIAFGLDDYSRGAIGLVPGEVTAGAIPVLRFCTDPDGNLLPDVTPADVDGVNIITARVQDGPGYDADGTDPSPAARFLSGLSDGQLRVFLNRRAGVIRSCHFSASDSG